jgi:hypothetical protein
MNEKNMEQASRKKNYDQPLILPDCIKELDFTQATQDDINNIFGGYEETPLIKNGKLILSHSSFSDCFGRHSGAAMGNMHGNAVFEFDPSTNTGKFIETTTERTKEGQHKKLNEHIEKASPEDIKTFFDYLKNTAKLHELDKQEKK